MADTGIGQGGVFHHSAITYGGTGTSTTGGKTEHDSSQDRLASMLPGISSVDFLRTGVVFVELTDGRTVELTLEEILKLKPETRRLPSGEVWSGDAGLPAAAAESR